MSGARATTAVLLHGFLGSPDDWQPIAGRLAGRVPCVAPPLADHPTLAALETAIRRSVPGPAVLIGYSMGARLALHLLLRDPDRYRVGVLACGSPGLASAAERAERRRADARLAARLRGLGDTRRCAASWTTGTPSRSSRRCNSTRATAACWRAACGSTPPRGRRR